MPPRIASEERAKEPVVWASWIAMETLRMAAKQTLQAIRITAGRALPCARRTTFCRETVLPAIACLPAQLDRRNAQAILGALLVYSPIRPIAEAVAFPAQATTFPLRPVALECARECVRLAFMTATTTRLWTDASHRSQTTRTTVALAALRAAPTTCRL